MTEQQRKTVEVLNRLYEAEMHSVLPRLSDLQVSTRESAASSLILRRLAAASREHRAWLVEAIDAAGGAVWPASLNPATAMLHYLSIRTVLPQAARDVESLLAAYDEAAQQRDLLPAAVELIGRITRRYRELLDQLTAVMRPAQPARGTSV